MSAVRYFFLETVLLRAGIKKGDIAKLLNCSKPTVWSRFKGTSDFTLKEAITIRDLISEKLDEDIDLERLFQTEEIENESELNDKE